MTFPKISNYLKGSTKMKNEYSIVSKCLKILYLIYIYIYVPMYINIFYSYPFEDIIVTVQSIYEV